jgi:hypothetical protein
MGSIASKPHDTEQVLQEAGQHPGEYARQVLRSPDAVFAAAGQMQRRQVLYTLSVQQTWWSLGAVALVALQLLLGCLQVSWASGGLYKPLWW